jgi:hypothetical protein
LDSEIEESGDEAPSSDEEEIPVPKKNSKGKKVQM